MRAFLRPPFLVLVLVLSCADAVAGEDPLEHAKSLVELGKTLIEVGQDVGDDKKVRDGVAKLREARKAFERALAAPDRSEAQRNRIKAWLVDVESRIEWYAPEAAKRGAGGRVFTGEVKMPPMKDGERIGAWIRRVRRVYDATDDPLGRASLARGIASKGGVVALPALFALFVREDLPAARVGVHEALARVGTSRVASRMTSYASRSKAAHWDHALDVIYRCLEKPERREPEKPFLRAVRAFHKLGVRKLSLRIVEHLHAMGGPGIAALGEILYVKDVGYHDYTIKLLGTKRDRRAVPPLVHKMNRFKFEGRVQKPAHEALLGMGWYAVPELIERLDDKAAGIWISWTLRKITGETMGTDRRKWRDWWRSERVRHPELFEDPDERPGGGKPPTTTGG